MIKNLSIDIPYAVRISDRARRCSIRVGLSDVTLIVPRRMGVSRAEAFLRQKTDWIRARLDKNQRTMAALPAGMILFRGVPVADSNEKVLRKQARAVIEAEVVVQGERMGVKPRRVFMRDQRTRWGSCSSRGNISLNWRLIMAPPEVLAYVVIHELAHLREANHGRRFWALVEAFLSGIPAAQEVAEGAWAFAAWSKDVVARGRRPRPQRMCGLRRTNGWCRLPSTGPRVGGNARHLWKSCSCGRDFPVPRRQNNGIEILADGRLCVRLSTTSFTQGRASWPRHQRDIFS